MKSVLALIVAPLAMLAVFVLALNLIDERIATSGEPLAEVLGFERVTISDHHFDIKVRGASVEPVAIAQLLIDGAFWEFEQIPRGPLKRGASASLSVDFPWVQNETHHIRVLSSSGATFDHTIDIARKTPQSSTAAITHYLVLGLLVGLVPVVIGMAFLPALRNGNEAVLAFVLSLGIGLLAYLLIDMIIEGLEFAEHASTYFSGASLFFVPFIAALLFLLSLGRGHSKVETGLRLATLIAFGIGLHNFGEGLAIGAAFASHQASLGAFLIIGFALHNVTEGLGIVAPLTGIRLRLNVLFGLACLAGLPAIPGIVLGALAFSAHWAAVFLAIGAGAVAQVIIELDRFKCRRQSEASAYARFSGLSVAGYLCGLAIMFATAMLIAI